jgi:hypothetical protein
MRLTIKHLTSMVEEELSKLIKANESKPRDEKYDCKIVSVDVEKEFEKSKSTSGKDTEQPIVKTTRVQKCKLK